MNRAPVTYEAVPCRDPVSDVEVKDVNPVIVVAVAPKAMLVLPTVTALFCN